MLRVFALVYVVAPGVGPLLLRRFDFGGLSSWPSVWGGDSFLVASGGLLLGTNVPFVHPIVLNMLGW